MKYEYMTLVLNNSDVECAGGCFVDKLNKHGKSGWELVSSLPQSYLGSSKYSLIGISQKNILIFKRAIAHSEGVSK